ERLHEAEHDHEQLIAERKAHQVELEKHLAERAALEEARDHEARRAWALEAELAAVRSRVAEGEDRGRGLVAETDELRRQIGFREHRTERLESEASELPGARDELERLRREMAALEEARDREAKRAAILEAKLGDTRRIVADTSRGVDETTRTI